MARLGIGIIAALLVPTVSAAQDVLTFEDGYRAVLYPMPGARTLAVRTAFERGWNADPEELPGAAHLVEHLWFRSRLVTDGATLYDRFQVEGCLVNGFTTPDRTRFITTCPSDAGSLVLDAHTALVRDPLVGLSAAEVAIENRVVRFEEAQREGWSVQAGRALLGRLLPQDHAAHAVWSPPDLDRDAIAAEAIGAWAKSAHAPDQAVLVVAGDFDAEALRARLIEAHGAIAPTSTDRPGGPSRAEPPAPVRRSGPNLSAPAPAPTLMLGWTLPPSTSAPAGSAIADRIGGSLAQRLETDESVLSVGCGFESQEAIDLLTCTVMFTVDAELAESSTSVVSRVEEIVEEELDARGRRAITKELAESIPRLESGLRALDRVPSAVAARLEGDVLALGTARSPQALADDLRAWSPGPSVREAMQWITVARMAQVRIQPDGTSFVLDDPAMEPVQPSPPAASRSHVVLADAPAAARTLSNGLELVAVQETNAVRTMASMRFGGGLDRFPTALTWVAERATGSPSGKSARGISTGEGLGLDHTELYVVADPGREAAALRKLRNLVVRRFPGFSDENRDRLDAMLDRVLAGRDAADADAQSVARKALLHAVVPGHAPSHGPSNADLESMGQLDPGAMMAYLVQTYQPQNAVLTLTGPQAPEVLLDLASETFGAWRARSGVAAGSPMRSPVAARPTSLAAFYADDRRSTANVAWMCRLPDGTHPGPASVIEEVLRARAWSRLRAEAGWTYTPGIQVLAWPDGTATVSLQAGARAREVAQVLDAMEGLVSDPDADELALARFVTLRRLMVLRDSQVSTEAAVFAAISANRDPTKPFAALRSPIDEVTQDQLIRSLSACRETGAWTVTGPPLAESVLRESGRLEAAP